MRESSQKGDNDDREPRGGHEKRRSVARESSQKDENDERERSGREHSRGRPSHDDAQDKESEQVGCRSVIISALSCAAWRIFHVPCSIQQPRRLRSLNGPIRHPQEYS